MSLFNEAQKKSDTIGQWQPHPLGRFPGVFEKIRKGDHQGATFYEIGMKTTEGGCKVTVWETWEKDVQGRLLARAQGDVAKAQKSYVDTMSRAIHLYNVAGLDKPQTEAEVYSRLGSLVGKPCVVEVKANKNDAQNPYINVYPPEGQEGAKGPGNGHPVYPNGGQTTAPAPESLPSLDEIPF